MADQKDLPSVEYSLKGISWQIKVIADQLVKLNDVLDKMLRQQVKQGDAPF